MQSAIIWPQLNDTIRWPGNDSNAEDIRFYDDSGLLLSDGVRFRFTTFGFSVKAAATEYAPLVAGRTGWRVPFRTQ